MKVAAHIQQLSRSVKRGIAYCHYHYFRTHHWTASYVIRIGLHDLSRSPCHSEFQWSIRQPCRIPPRLPKTLPKGRSLTACESRHSISRHSLPFHAFQRLIVSQHDEKEEKRPDSGSADSAAMVLLLYAINAQFNLEQRLTRRTGERDFDDMVILTSHQKAKHFKCDKCNRRLNTAGGLQGASSKTMRYCCDRSVNTSSQST